MNIDRTYAAWMSANKLELVAGTLPSPGDDEIVLKVAACAICGSDLRILKHGNSRVRSGQIVGHEISGVVFSVGRNVVDWQIGDRLSVGADVPCGECEHCLSGHPNCCDINYAIGHQFEGGFTDYMVLNALALKYGPVHKLKADTKLDVAALAEPLACCINGYEVGMMEEGRNVVIFGAGPIGMMLAMLATTYKAPSIILVDPNSFRLNKAKELLIGTHFINPNDDDVVKRVLEITDGVGGQMVFTACPSVDAQKMAIQLVAKRGVVNLFGGLPLAANPLEFQSNAIHYKEAYITGSHGSTPKQHSKAIEIIESDSLPIEKLITHRFSLGQIHDAYEVAASGDAIKVLINPNA